MKLDGEYAIVADMYNVILKRKYKSTRKPARGEPKEVSEDIIGYYASVTSAVMAYRKEMVKTWVAGEEITLDAILDRIEALDKKLLKRLAVDDEPLLEATREKDAKLKEERAAAKRNGKVKADG